LSKRNETMTLRSTYMKDLWPAEAFTMQNIVTSEINGWGNFSGHSTRSHNYKKKILKGDTVVVDHVPGLMWAQFCDYREWRIWDTYSIAFRTNYKTYAGFCDWRLPTLEEAASLLEDNALQDGLRISSIFEMRQRKIWTRDSYVKRNTDLLGDEIQVWYVDFGTSEKNFQHWDRGRAEACICLVRSDSSPAKPFDPYQVLELFAADLLGRDINPQEYDIIHYTDIEQEIHGAGDIFLLATHPPSMVDTNFRNQIPVLHQRILESIRKHSEKLEKTVGRRLSDLETARLCQLDKFMALDEMFERIFAADNAESTLEFELSSLIRPYVPLRFDSMQHMNRKKLRGQIWAFYPLGRVVLLLCENIRDIEKLALHFWNSFEILDPFVVKKLNEVLPKEMQAIWGPDYYDQLCVFYFYVEYEGSPGIDICFRLDFQGIVVGIKEGQIAYIDEYKVKDNYPRDRLWEKVAESKSNQESADLLKAEQEWKIEQVTIKTRDSYFESDVTYEFLVINKKTEKVFASFWRSEYSDDRGSVARGCRSVVFSKDGRSIIATYEDGKKEVRELLSPE